MLCHAEVRPRMRASHPLSGHTLARRAARRRRRAPAHPETFPRRDQHRGPRSLAMLTAPEPSAVSTAEDTLPVVLVVDDSPIDRRLAGGILQQRGGVRVIYAQHGVAATRGPRAGSSRADRHRPADARDGRAGIGGDRAGAVSARADHLDDGSRQRGGSDAGPEPQGRSYVPKTQAGERPGRYGQRRAADHAQSPAAAAAGPRALDADRVPFLPGERRDADSAARFAPTGLPANGPTLRRDGAGPRRRRTARSPPQRDAPRQSRA